MYPYNSDPTTKAFIDGKMSMVRRSGQKAGFALKRGSWVEMASFRTKLREVRDRLQVYRIYSCYIY